MLPDTAIDRYQLSNYERVNVGEIAETGPARSFYLYSRSHESLHFVSRYERNETDVILQSRDFPYRDDLEDRRFGERETYLSIDRKEEPRRRHAERISNEPFESRVSDDDTDSSRSRFVGRVTPI